MILLLHVIIAISSMASVTVAFFLPSKSKLKLSSTLIALTLASGTYLVISSHVPLFGACITGLVYIGGVLAGMAAAYHRLARQETK